MFILKVEWDNQVVEIFRSELAGADFKATVPHVIEVIELAHVLQP